MTTTQRIARSRLVSVYQDQHSGGWVAECRGLYDFEKGYHIWERVGVFGSRQAAETAVANFMGWGES